MNIEGSNLGHIKYKMGAIGFLISFLLHFNSHSLLVLGLELVLGFFVGFLLGIVKTRFELKRYKYPLYFVLALSFVLVLIFPFLSGRCLAYMPYTAENIFTGAEKEFVYGGCGPRPHPWYYTTN